MVQIGLGIRWGRGKPAGEVVVVKRLVGIGLAALNRCTKYRRVCLAMLVGLLVRKAGAWQIEQDVSPSRITQLPSAWQVGWCLWDGRVSQTLGRVKRAVKGLNRGIVL